MKKLGFLAGVALAILAVGCDGAHPPGNGAGGGGGGEPSILTPAYWTKDSAASLVSFSGGTACSSAEKYLADVMVAQMKKQLESDRRYLHQYGGCYYCYGGGGGSGGGAGGGSSAGGAGGAGGGSAGGPSDYTTTNNQVVGVDEPDMMKNDGNRIFVLANQHLYTATSWPPENLAQVGQVALSSEQWSTDMFLDGDHVAVLGTRYDSSYGSSRTTTLVTMIDVSDLSAPKVTGRYEVPGYYLSARMIGHTVRLVTSWGLDMPDGVQTWYWPSQQLTSEEIDRAIDALELSNELKIRARTLDQWLGGSTWVDSTGAARYYPLDCSALAHSSVPVQPGATNVYTFDLDDHSVFDRQAVLENTDLIYSSTDSLYLVSRDWWWWWYSYVDYSYTGTWDGMSVIHKFDISNTTRAEYQATGEVAGFPLNQFSLDEYQGFLRVAMMGPSWNGARIEVLAQAGDKLVMAGQTPPVANGEQLESVRFVGPRGYLSTFHYVYQVDPLFTVDLSNPLEPTVVGQLTIPGYSTYLHPIDDTHLLAVGEWVPETPGDWTGRHLQLSLFDVSDIKNPVQVATQALGSYPAEQNGWTYGWGWSEALWDHHAFNYFPSKGVVAVPFNWWQEHYTSDGSGYYSYDYRVGAEVDLFKVDPQTGFTSLGAVQMTDLPSQSSYWWYDSWVRRSVMADDYVYAIGAGGIRVARIDSPGTTIATAPFPAP